MSGCSVRSVRQKGENFEVEQMTVRIIGISPLVLHRFKVYPGCCHRPDPKEMERENFIVRVFGSYPGFWHSFEKEVKRPLK